MRTDQMIGGVVKNTIVTDLKRYSWLYLLLLPATLFTFVFGYLTLPYLLIAFQKFNYQTGLFDSQ